MRLKEHITAWMIYQKNKHGLEEDYEVRMVDEMSNFELLERISDALDEMGVFDEPR